MITVEARQSCLPCSQRDLRETISHMDSKCLPRHLGTQTFTGETLVPDYTYNQEGDETYIIHMVSPPYLWVPTTRIENIPK